MVSVWTSPRHHGVQRRLRRNPRRLIAVAVLALVTILGAAFWYDSHRDERRAVQGLSDSERGALFQRTLRNLESSCHVGARGLDDFCRTQAEFILEFPECDARCSQLAKDYLAHPSR